mmetsp:Transcript_83638/g.249565  ORF Transcript_83638/g.249565 Transcript_83638/m.249565 type:complete len:234 (+) Transcript_83638:1153-1854(+)
MPSQQQQRNPACGRRSDTSARRSSRPVDALRRSTSPRSLGGAAPDHPHLAALPRPPFEPRPRLARVLRWPGQSPSRLRRRWPWHSQESVPSPLPPLDPRNCSCLEWPQVDPRRAGPQLPRAGSSSWPSRCASLRWVWHLTKLPWRAPLGSWLERPLGHGQGHCRSWCQMRPTLRLHPQPPRPKRRRQPSGGPPAAASARRLAAKTEDTAAAGRRWVGSPASRRDGSEPVLRSH